MDKHFQWKLDTDEFYFIFGFASIYFKNIFDCRKSGQNAFCMLVPIYTIFHNFAKPTSLLAHIFI